MDMEITLSEKKRISKKTIEGMVGLIVQDEEGNWFIAEQVEGEWSKKIQRMIKGTLMKINKATVHNNLKATPSYQYKYFVTDIKVEFSLKHKD